MDSKEYTYVNLVSSSFLDEIKCDKVVNEFFPLSNLCSDQEAFSVIPTSVINLNRINNKGFMVERFVKPPVTVLVRLKSSVKVAFIDVGLCVGSQKSVAIEIYVGKSESLLRKVAAAYPPYTNTETYLRFCVKNQENSLPEFFEGKIFHFFKTENLVDVTYLAIKICRAEYVPCLSYLKIWSPQKCVKNDEILHDSVGQNERICDLTIQRESGENSIVENLNFDHEIPDEFHDPITCECMCLPVVLPSGHTVDRSTLEKYVCVEAECGRPPNDPYTGVKFTANSYPLANTSLKSRIDKFFLSKPDLARKINFGRTLCGKNYIAWPLKCSR